MPFPGIQFSLRRLLAALSGLCIGLAVLPWSRELGVGLLLTTLAAAQGDYRDANARRRARLLGFFLTALLGYLAFYYRQTESLSDDSTSSWISTRSMGLPFPWLDVRSKEVTEWNWPEVRRHTERSFGISWPPLFAAIALAASSAVALDHLWRLWTLNLGDAAARSLACGLIIVAGAGLLAGLILSAAPEWLEWFPCFVILPCALIAACWRDARTSVAAVASTLGVISLAWATQITVGFEGEPHLGILNWFFFAFALGCLWWLYFVPLSIMVLVRRRWKKRRLTPTGR